jgi:DNA repair photolyase
VTIPDLKPFAGAFLMSPIPLELSFHWCSFACSYCFANLNTPRRRSNVTQLMNFLADYPQRSTLEATLLQQGYPVCLSNLTDMFAPSNYHTALPVIEILSDLGIPLHIQTRGTDRPAWREELLARIPPPAVWYISITTLDDTIRARIEPKAPTVASRLALIARLRRDGHTVVVGLNPLVPEWCGDPATLVATCQQAGAQGCWIERLHLNATQIAQMPARDQAALGTDLLARARKRAPAAPDRAVFDAARAAAQARGLPVYSYGQPTPSGFFDLYHQVYQGRTFATTQDVVNDCYQTHAQTRLLTFDEYARVLLPRLPDGVHPLDQYIGSTAHTLFQQTTIPTRMSYREVLTLGWCYHQPKFSPVTLPCFAWAAQWDEAQGGWLRYTDEAGLPLLVFRPDPPLTTTCVATHLTGQVATPA